MGPCPRGLGQRGELALRSRFFLHGARVLHELEVLVILQLRYLGAARGWQVVTFAEPTWRALLVLALGWAMATPALAWLARRGSASAPPRSATRGARA